MRAENFICIVKRLGAEASQAVLVGVEWCRDVLIAELSGCVLITTAFREAVWQTLVGMGRNTLDEFDFTLIFGGCPFGNFSLLPIFPQTLRWVIQCRMGLQPIVLKSWTPEDTV